MPTVASYCSVFLKPEMLHIYRQVSALQRYRTFVVTKELLAPETFPFSEMEVLEKPQKHLWRRFVRKYVQGKAPFIYRGEYDALMRVIDRRKPDLMHIYFGHTGVHLLPFIRESKLPCVVSFHGADVMPRADRPGYETDLRALLQTVPLVLARSESLARKLQDYGCPAEKIRLNRTGIPLDQFPFVPGSETGQHFVQACRLIEKKGLKTTLSAFAETLRTFPDAKLTIAGDGPMREELQSLAVELGVASRVTFAGFLSQAQLRELYAASHIFLHPSETTETADQEGVPNSMLEAMSTGLPVLATLHGGIPEVVRSGSDGLLVAERDYQALAQAMIALLRDPAQRLAMGKSASARVREEFAQSAQIEHLEASYDEVLRRAAGGDRVVDFPG